MKIIQNKNTQLITSVSGIQKLMLSMCAAAVAYLLLLLLPFEISSRILLSWDIFCLCMMGLSWLLFFSTSAEDLPTVVEKQDENLKVIFSIVLLAVCFSLFGTLMLIIKTDETEWSKIFEAVISISSIAFTWFLLHTIFTIRYAHLYHDQNELNTGSNAGGIDFPGKDSPDYLDFAYFSFVIGMTFQVSDISISSPLIRRFVLLHSLLAFVFNTIIVALTINTVASM